MIGTMTESQLKSQTKRLALDTIKFVRNLPKNEITFVLGKQLLRSGTSVGANYRAACRARSDAEMIAKLGLVEEEADESQYWLELIVESGYDDAGVVEPLWKEFDEILAITVSSKKTLRTRNLKV